MQGLTEVDVRAALRAASTAELSWLEDGHPQGSAVVPLQIDGEPVIAVPYAHADWARAVAAHGEVVLTVSDPRLSGRRWKALELRAAPRLVEDRDGVLFCDAMLEDELRKHPPSRALVNSLMLRRENWWYLPRLVLHLDVRGVSPFVERFGPDETILITGEDGRPRVRGVRVARWDDVPLRLESLSAAETDLPDAPEAMLLGHDFTEPDMERWQTFRARGSLTAGSMNAPTPPVRSPARMPRLVERLRAHRDLRRGCLQGLRPG